MSCCAAGQQVYCVRSRCGKQLALEAPADADLVSTIPESATPAALGYAAQASDIYNNNSNSIYFFYSAIPTALLLIALYSIIKIKKHSN